MSLKVAICGGRGLDRNKAFNLLETGLYAELPDTLSVIIHGDASGADQGAGDWAASEHIRCVTEPADWKKYPKTAGPIRNQLIIDKHKPDVVVALPGGNGTRDMIKRAKAAGIRVIYLGW